MVMVETISTLQALASSARSSCGDRKRDKACESISKSLWNYVGMMHLICARKKKTASSTKRRPHSVQLAALDHRRTLQRYQKWRSGHATSSPVLVIFFFFTVVS